VITKSTRFAAPYTSATFNHTQSLVTGVSGVVSGMSVTTSGGIVTVQPGTFVQNGLYVQSDLPFSATLPTSITAPYFVAVTTSSSVQSASEVITPTFVKRPEDVSADTVLVAEWDGQEWRPLPQIQIEDLIQATQKQAVAQGFSGISGGMGVTLSSGQVEVASGSLIDRQGRLTTKTATEFFTPIATDADSLGRIDKIVFRRPDDDSARIGVVEYVLGQAYNPSSNYTQLHETGLDATLNTHGVAKTLSNPTDNTSYFLYLQDYGTRGFITLASSPDLMTSVNVAGTLATDVSSFDGILNPEGSIDLIYTRGNSLFYKRVTTLGVTVYPEVQIATGTQVLTNPKLVSLTSGSSYFLHAVYESVVDVAQHTLYYIRLSSQNTVETPAELLVNLSSIITNPSLEKDDGDSLLLLAYENQTTARVYLRNYDGSTATASSAPTQLGATIELENDTLILSNSAIAPVGGSSKPIVKRSNTKDTFVFWLQDKGASLFGVAIYNSRYLNTFGHKAIIVDLASAGETIAIFDADIDAVGYGHIAALVSPNTIKASFNLYTGERTAGSGTIWSSTVPSQVRTHFNVRGSLVHTWVTTSTGFSNNNGTKPITFFGPGTFLASQAISSTEFVMLQSDYNALPSVPTTGDKIVITAAGVNDNTYNFIASRIFSVSAVAYVAIQIDAPTFDNSVASGTSQFQVQAGNQSFFVKSTAGVFDNLRSYFVPPTDVYLADYRTQDATISASDTAVNEIQPLTRISEFMNSVGTGGGVASWSRATTNVFTFTDSIVFRFFNREASYTIPANPTGITILPGQVAYVQIPDEDTDATLTLKVIDSGDGILDRYSRNTVTPFWNISGRLYTTLPPFSLAPGETTTIGVDLAQLVLSQLQLQASTVSASRATVSGTDVTLPDGSILSEQISGLVALFPDPAGAVIDFATGSIFNSNGVTPLGINFIPAAIPVGNYLWYGIGFVAKDVNTNNTISSQLLVIPAASSNAVATSATFPDIAGDTKIGLVLVQNVGGVITVHTIRRFGLGSGGGGSTTYSAIAGEAISAGQPVYISSAGDAGRTTGQLYKLDATSATRMEYAGVMVRSSAAGGTATVAVTGPIGGLSGLLPGQPVFASVTSPGGLQNTAPTVNGQYIIQVGTAETSTSLLINGALSSTAILVSPTHIYAEQDLSNLADPTKISQILTFAPDVDFAAIQTPDSDTDSTQPLRVTTGNSSTGVTGGLTVSTGNSAGTFFASGSVNVFSGDSTASGGSGNVSIKSGSSSTTTGSIFIATSNSQISGSINLSTGNAPTGPNFSGSINIVTGATSGSGAGNRGSITLDGAAVQIITPIGLFIGSSFSGIGPSTILNLESTSKALLLTRITDESTITSATAGMVIYNTALGKFRGFGTTGWADLGSGGGSGSVSPIGQVLATFFSGTTWQLPATPVSAVSTSVYIDGLPSIGDWSLSGNQITFNSNPPSAGQSVTSTFYTSIGTGGGGAGGQTVQWVEDTASPIAAIEFNQQVYMYQSSLGQVLYASVQVPIDYVPGAQISLSTDVYSPDATGAVTFRTTSTLVRVLIDPINTTTNTATATSSLLLSTAYVPGRLSHFLTDATGKINGVSVNPGDLIKIAYARFTDTATSDARLLPLSALVKFA